MSNSRNSKRMVESTSTYIDQLLESHSKIQVIRLDLGYTKSHASKASLEEINQDLTHLLNNRRTKPSVFGNMVGYIAKKNSPRTEARISTVCSSLTDKRSARMHIKEIRLGSTGKTRLRVERAFSITAIGRKASTQCARWA